MPKLVMMFMTLQPSLLGAPDVANSQLIYAPASAVAIIASDWIGAKSFCSSPRQPA